MTVKVSLASGEAFWVAADLEVVAALFQKRTLIRVGSRHVNATQVTQLTVERCPSVETPELLED